MNLGKETKNQSSPNTLFSPTCPTGMSPQTIMAWTSRPLQRHLKATSDIIREGEVAYSLCRGLVGNISRCGNNNCHYYNNDLSSYTIGSGKFIVFS